MIEKQGKVSRKRIPKAKPYMGLEEMEQLAKVLQSGWLSNGPKTRELEEAIGNYLGIAKEQVVMVTNCTAALHASLLALGVGPGDEVLVADFTFPATAHAVMYCGAVPRFIDIDLETFNMDSSKVEEKINKRTKAIIPVHTFGNPAEMDELERIAEKHGLSLVEDAACAFGAEYRDRPAGTIGDIGCFSFHAIKGITCGEGGAIVSRDRKVAEKVKRLCNYGIESAWDRHTNVSIPSFTTLGYNYKISDLQSGVVLAQLGKIEGILERRLKLASEWSKNLAPLVRKGSLTEQLSPEHIVPCHQSEVVLLDQRVDRNKVIKTLSEEYAVETTLGTYSCHVQPVYHSSDVCPNARIAADQSISLPFYYEITEELIRYCADSLAASIEKSKRSD